MEGRAQNSKPQSYMILRIKRKRNEEPLDALVVESRARRKKSRGGVGVFQYAQTVEQDAWGNEQQQNDLRNQISRLAHEVPPQPDGHPSAPSSPSYRRNSKDEPARRYKIIEQTFEGSEAKDPSIRPPGITDHDPVPPSNGITGLKMYSAVLSTDNLSEPEVDPEIEKFLPLLNDYLKIHDIMPSSAESPSSCKPETTTSPSEGATSDFVWDIFYHRPTSLVEFNEAANVGTLTGLPSMVTGSDESESESEDGDIDDEDSNAEEYYKNDYPDEEDPSTDGNGSSDEFHEHSDYDNDRRFTDDEDVLWR